MDTRETASDIYPNGTIIADRYEITSFLAAGGMAQVYVANQQQINRSVALKVLSSMFSMNPNVVMRFFREAQVIGALSHPNTVRIYDMGETPDHRLFIAMELLKGEELSERIKRGVMTPAEALPIVRQVAGSLSEAHQQGIIHRDLKPDNIFLTNLNVVKVLDFGIAKLKADDSDEGSERKLTKAGTAPGTAEYMSPEQARGKELDARSDLYSLGIVLYEMLCGHPPFEESTFLGTILLQVQSAPPPLPETVPMPLRNYIINRLLAKDPNCRPDNAELFIQEIDELSHKLKLDRTDVVLEENSEKLNDAKKEIEKLRSQLAHAQMELLKSTDCAALVDTEIPQFVPPPVRSALPNSEVCINTKSATFQKDSLPLSRRSAPPLPPLPPTGGSQPGMNSVKMSSQSVMPSAMCSPVSVPPGGMPPRGPMASGMPMGVVGGNSQQQQPMASGVMPVLVNPQQQPMASGVMPVLMSPQQPMASGVMPVLVNPQQPMASGVMPVLMSPQQQPMASGVMPVLMSPQQPMMQPSGVMPAYAQGGRMHEGMPQPMMPPQMMRKSQSGMPNIPRGGGSVAPGVRSVVPPMMQDEEPVIPPQPRHMERSAENRVQQHHHVQDTSSLPFRDEVEEEEEDVSSLNSRPKDTITGAPVVRSGNGSMVPGNYENTFMMYAQPLASKLGPEKIEEALEMARSIWNATIVGLDAVQVLIESAGRESNLSKLIRLMVERKQKYFSQDNWKVDDIIVNRDGSGRLDIQVLFRPI